MQTSVTLPGCW